MGQSMAPGPSPLVLLATWREQASAANDPEPDAMVLATATPEGAPSARVVLCRGIGEDGIRFFTNYESRKGKELASNPSAAALFFWPSLGRQVRLEGTVKKLAAADSDAYFALRPRGHQLGAWASAQSHPIDSLELVKARHAELAQTWTGKEVPRPPFWGGYLLVPAVIELWEEGENRLHTRRLFRRENTAVPPRWSETLLAP
jgi:pyridoxamine 5'-phosphate oxidase